MSKRKKERPAPRPARTAPRGPVDELEQTLQRAQRLCDAGEAGQAIAFLEPLAAAQPRTAELQYALGYSLFLAGEPWRALPLYERAVELGRDEGHTFALAILYHELGLYGYALQAFRKLPHRSLDARQDRAVRETISELEADMRQVAERFDVPVSRVEEAVRSLNAAQRALQAADYAAAIRENRQAIRKLGDWLPPRNNLALALFFDGQPEQAIDETRQVLARDPDNVQALSNAVRFLAWSGRHDEAVNMWARLRTLTPDTPEDRMKGAEAAAVMEDDERVLELLVGVAGTAERQPDVTGLRAHARFFVAVAKANLGTKDAERYMAAVQRDVPGAKPYLQALRAGRRGLGWAERFPYFPISQLLPGNRMEEFVELVKRADERPTERAEREVARFVERFPQLVLMGEKVIWEEMQPAAAVAMLLRVGTPAAHAAIRRFALSQAGSDDDRTQALTRLAHAGAIPQGETVRVWHKGEWHEVQLRQIEVGESERRTRAPQVQALVTEGLEAVRAGDLARAEDRFLRAIKMEPGTADLYNNLGTIYSRREEPARAKEAYRKAMALDPLYAVPRVNLNRYLLEEGDVEGAIEMLRPLTQATRLRPYDAAVFAFGQARILIEQEEYDEAERLLEQALEVWPEYEEAREWLQWLRVTHLEGAWERFFGPYRRRALARRHRLQASLNTLEPALADALALYTKDELTGIARTVIPEGGWSTLRKGELVARIVANLTDPRRLADLSSRWSDEAQDALIEVMERGGAMPWEAFEEKYDSDLDTPLTAPHAPESVMGELRRQGLIVEATVDGEVWVVVPVELRPLLKEIEDA